MLTNASFVASTCVVSTKASRVAYIKGMCIYCGPISVGKVSFGVVSRGRSYWFVTTTEPADVCSVFFGTHRGR